MEEYIYKRRYAEEFNTYLKNLKDTQKKLYNTIKSCDNRIQDLLHFMENPHNAAICAKANKELRELRKLRRKTKTEADDIRVVLNQFKNTNLFLPETISCKHTYKTDVIARIFEEEKED